MTLQEDVWGMAAGAVALAAVTTWLDVSARRVFALAGIATAATVVLAKYVAAQPCGVASAGYWPLDASIVLSLTLIGAASLGGVVEGIRLGKTGDHGAALARCVGFPLAGAAGVGVVFFAILLAIAHCLN